MNRRQFLKKTAQTGLAVSAAARLSAETLGVRVPLDQDPEKPKRKHWIWSGLDRNASDSTLKAKYARFREHGVTGAFLAGGVDDREFSIVKEAGLELHCWMFTVNRGDQWLMKNHPDWYMVSRSGKSCFDHPPYVGYYRWVSPVIPGVRDYIKDRGEELVRHPAVSGLHLDYVRYPDVILPKGLWKQYGLIQTEELPDYDFCYGAHTREAFKKAFGRDPLEIKDPANDQQWLHFRCDSVTRLVKELAAMVHRRKKQITAAVFPTPSMARKICRQDWDKWPLDAACPMLYHSFYEEPVDWIGQSMIENVQAVKFPVYAGIYLPALQDLEDFKKAIRVAHKRGAAGISLFGSMDDAHWDAFRTTIGES